MHGDAASVVLTYNLKGAARDNRTRQIYDFNDLCKFIIEFFLLNDYKSIGFE
jgi:hypothetical protein